MHFHLAAIERRLRIPGRSLMKRAAIYLRVSTIDQHPETQLYDLRALADQRGYEIVMEYRDTICGAKSKRPGLDRMMSDARRGRFDVVVVWAFDRMARSVRHFLEVLDDLNHLNIEFVSRQENIDTGGPLGRAMIVIVGAIAELERNLIIERVRAGMRRAKLEGRHIGRRALDLDEPAIREPAGRRANPPRHRHRPPHLDRHRPEGAQTGQSGLCGKGRKPPLWDPHKQRAENGCLARFGPCENLWIESQSAAVPELDEPSSPLRIGLLELRKPGTINTQRLWK